MCPMAKGERKGKKGGVIRCPFFLSGRGIRGAFPLRGGSIRRPVPVSERPARRATPLREGPVLRPVPLREGPVRGGTVGNGAKCRCEGRKSGGALP